MRFSILAKIGLLFAVVLVSAMAFILWNTNRVFYQDKEAFVIEINSKLSQSVSQLMEEKVDNFTSKLAIFAGNYESLTPGQKKQAGLNSVLFAQYEDFYHIASIRLQDKKVLWDVSNNLSQANTWPIGYAGTLLSSLSLGQAKSDALYFQRLSAPDGKPIFAMMIKAQLQAGDDKAAPSEVVLVGLVQPQIFADVVAGYKAALNTAFLVDNTGFVYAHPEENLLGTSLVGNTIVKEIKAKAKPAGAGDSYKDKKGIEIAGGYEKIGSTNLYAVISTPREEAFRAANELFKTLVVIGGGILLIGMVLSFVFAQLITSPLKKLKKVAAEIGDGNFSVPVSVSSRDEVGDLASSISQMANSLVEREEALENSKMALVQSEKMSAFGQLSAGIAHEVKNPLAGILGHAQLAKAKIKNDDILKHIEVIESETRRTKEIIEGLMKFARAEKLELQPSNMWDVTHAAVDLVEHQLSLQGVKIKRHIKRVPCVLANGTQIQQVMLNLMMNAGHAMEEMDVKELHIYLDLVEDKDVARIRIQDTGTGMPKDVADKIFEPFFTTKPAGKGTGLGLSVSVGIVKDHNAEIYVESEMGVGTTFFMDFPIAHDQALPESTYEPKFAHDMPEEDEEPAPQVQSRSAVVSSEEVAEPMDPKPLENLTESVADSGIIITEEVEAPEAEGELDHESTQWQALTESELESQSEPKSNPPTETESPSTEVITESEDEYVDEVSLITDLPKLKSEDDDEGEFAGLPEVPASHGEEDDDDDEVFQEQSLSDTAEALDKEYSAANALAGFDLDDEESLELDEKTVIGEIPDMPAPDRKTEDESTQIVDTIEEKDKPEDSGGFQVKIRKPKIKR